MTFMLIFNFVICLFFNVLPSFAKLDDTDSGFINVVKTARPSFDNKGVLQAAAKGFNEDKAPGTHIVWRMLKHLLTSGNEVLVGLHHNIVASYENNGAWFEELTGYKWGKQKLSPTEAAIYNAGCKVKLLEGRCCQSPDLWSAHRYVVNRLLGCADLSNKNDVKTWSENKEFWGDCNAILGGGRVEDMLIEVATPADRPAEPTGGREDKAWTGDKLKELFLGRGKYIYFDPERIKGTDFERIKKEDWNVYKLSGYPWGPTLKVSGNANVDDKWWGSVVECGVLQRCDGFVLEGFAAQKIPSALWSKIITQLIKANVKHITIVNGVMPQDSRDRLDEYAKANKLGKAYRLVQCGVSRG